jgi:hypothetical protein
MALVIDDPEVERLARGLANARQTNLSESLALALREQLLREHHPPGTKPLSEILANVNRRMSGVPRYHADKTDEELLGYNEAGHVD